MAENIEEPSRMGFGDETSCFCPKLPDRSLLKPENVLFEALHILETGLVLPWP